MAGWTWNELLSSLRVLTSTRARRGSGLQRQRGGRAGKATRARPGRARPPNQRRRPSPPQPLARPPSSVPSEPAGACRPRARPLARLLPLLPATGRMRIGCRALSSPGLQRRSSSSSSYALPATRLAGGPSPRLTSWTPSSSSLQSQAGLRAYPVSTSILDFTPAVLVHPGAAARASSGPAHELVSSGGDSSTWIGRIDGAWPDLPSRALSMLVVSLTFLLYVPARLLW